MIEASPAWRGARARRRRGRARREAARPRSRSTRSISRAHGGAAWRPRARRARRRGARAARPRSARGCGRRPRTRSRGPGSRRSSGARSAWPRTARPRPAATTQAPSTSKRRRSRKLDEPVHGGLHRGSPSVGPGWPASQTFPGASGIVCDGRHTHREAGARVDAQRARRAGGARSATPEPEGGVAVPVRVRDHLDPEAVAEREQHRGDRLGVALRAGPRPRAPWRAAPRPGGARQRR